MLFLLVAYAVSMFSCVDGKTNAGYDEVNLWLGCCVLKWTVFQVFGITMRVATLKLRGLRSYR